MSDLDRELDRLWLDAHAAQATALLLQGGDVDGYLDSVGYTARLTAYKTAGGVL
jgi:hypothetical protein